MLRPLSPLDTSSGRGSGGGLLRELQTIAVLRIGAGLVLFLGFGLEATLQAWHYIWSQRPFPLVATLQQTWLPLPNVVAPATAFIAATVAIAWILGFFTRLFSAMFLVVVLLALTIMGSIHATETDYVVAWLFVFISVTLLLYGSGQISVDGLFSLGGGKKQKRLF